MPDGTSEKWLVYGVYQAQHWGSTETERF